MDDDDLIEAIRLRALDPTTRTDWAVNAPTELARRATEDEIAEVERALEYSLHWFHRRLLLDVGNGGYGPGDGLIGLPGGRTDDEGRTVVELQALVAVVEGHGGLVRNIVPLWDWGDGAWACMDEETGHVLVADDSGITDSGVSLQTCMVEWVAGRDVTERFFAFEDRSGINPFSGKPMTARMRGHPLGKSYTIRGVRS
jgi:hypothetical protein